jgi:hypothetical protein
MNDIEMKTELPSCYGRINAILDEIHRQQMIYNLLLYLFGVNDINLHQLIFDSLRRCSFNRDEYHGMIINYWG